MFSFGIILWLCSLYVRDVVSFILLPRVVYLITCCVVLFNRVRLGRVVDFTGLPVYWFTGFINLSVLLC